MPSLDLAAAAWRVFYVVEQVQAGLSPAPRWKARRARQHVDGPHHLGSYPTEAEAWRAVDEDWSG